MGPCKVCVEKSDQIREILRPFQLEHVEPVGGVRLLGKSLAEARAQVAALTAEREAEAERRANELRALKPGWDSYGAVPITAAAINAALRFLRGAMRITPCSSGGVQIDGQGAEIVFGPDGEQEFDGSNRLAEAERLLKVAREAIRQAPCSQVCPSRRLWGEYFLSRNCDCWKSKALAEIAPAAPEGSV